MLDAYIIDRIRREREEQDRRQSRVPLHIEPPPQQPVSGPATDDDRPERNDSDERGSVVIDFHV